MYNYIIFEEKTGRKYLEIFYSSLDRALEYIRDYVSTSNIIASGRIVRRSSTPLPYNEEIVLIALAE